MALVTRPSIGDLANQRAIYLDYSPDTPLRHRHVNKREGLVPENGGTSGGSGPLRSAYIYGAGKYFPLVGSSTYAIANAPRLRVTSMETSHTIKRF